LQFADAFVQNLDTMKAVGLTEVKSENVIRRLSSEAMPRQIERVNAGTVFAETIVYDATDPQEMQEDLQMLAKAMKLLQMDYLGGHGSRGSGRVSLKNFRIRSFGGEVDCAALKKWFDEVAEYELFTVSAPV
jgi:CRISPR-associated protein Csm3